MFENIQKAVGTQPQPQQSKLSYEEQSQNYAIFSDLMKKGVRLQDLIDKANAPKEPPVDPVVFSVMEEAVKDEVRDVSSRRRDIGKKVLAKMLMTDPEYAKADKEYHDAVIRAYMLKKEVRGENTTQEAPLTAEDEQKPLEV